MRLFIPLLCLVLIGCSQTRPEQKSTWKQPWVIPQSEMPKWISDPTLGNTIEGGIGSIDYSPTMSYSERKELATNRARQAISASRKVKIKAVTKDYTSESHAGLTMYNENTAIASTYDILENSLVKEVWEHPKTQEMYVWVIINK